MSFSGYSLVGRVLMDLKLYIYDIIDNYHWVVIYLFI